MKVMKFKSLILTLTKLDSRLFRIKFQKKNNEKEQLLQQAYAFDIKSF